MDVVNALISWTNRLMGWGDVAVYEGRNYSGWLFMGVFFLFLSKVLNIKLKIGGK